MATRAKITHTKPPNNRNHPQSRIRSSPPANRSVLSARIRTSSSGPPPGAKPAATFTSYVPVPVPFVRDQRLRFRHPSRAVLQNRRMGRRRSRAPGAAVVDAQLPRGAPGRSIEDRVTHRELHHPASDPERGCIQGSFKPCWGSPQTTLRIQISRARLSGPSRRSLVLLAPGVLAPRCHRHQSGRRLQWLCAGSATPSSTAEHLTPPPTLSPSRPI